MLCMGDVLWGMWLWFKVNKTSPSKGKAVVTQPGAEATSLKGTAFSQQHLLDWLKFPFSLLKGLYDDTVWDMVWKWTFGALRTLGLYTVWQLLEAWHMKMRWIVFSLRKALWAGIITPGIAAARPQEKKKKPSELGSGTCPQHTVSLVTKPLEETHGF